MIEFKKNDSEIYVKQNNEWIKKELENEIPDFLAYFPGIGGCYVFSNLNKCIYVTFYNWHGKKIYSKILDKDCIYRANNKTVFKYIPNDNHTIDSILDEMHLSKKRKYHSGDLWLIKVGNYYDFFTDGEIERYETGKQVKFLIKNATYCIEKTSYVNSMGYLVSKILSVYVFSNCDANNLKKQLLSF